jgi:hypothetical protein
MVIGRTLPNIGFRDVIKGRRHGIFLSRIVLTFFTPDEQLISSSTMCPSVDTTPSDPATAKPNIAPTNASEGDSTTIAADATIELSSVNGPEVGSNSMTASSAVAVADAISTTDSAVMNNVTQTKFAAKASFNPAERSCALWRLIQPAYPSQIKAACR